MDIILKTDIKGLGYKNDVVTVKPGYGRNYLIPQGFALLATKEEELVLLKEDGGTLPVSLRKYHVVARGGRGHPVIKRGRLTGLMPPDLTVPVFQQDPVP